MFSYETQSWNLMGEGGIDEETGYPRLLYLLLLRRKRRVRLMLYLRKPPGSPSWDARAKGFLERLYFSQA